jgi:hypothetical protein
MSSSTSEHPAVSSRLPCRAALRIAGALALATLAASATAALYKWTDANGRVVYSDQPPPPGANANAEVMKPPPPPANPNAARELATKEIEFRKRVADRADEPKRAEKAKAEANWCAQVRGQIRLFSGDDIVYRANERGERVYLDQEAKRKEVERLEQMAKDQHCPG